MFRARRTLWVALSIVLAAYGATVAPGNGATSNPVTLTIWDAEVGGASDIMKQINAAFEKQHPNISINRTVYAWSDLRTKDKLAITGPNPPDVIQEAGIPAIGPSLVQAGALVNLDPIANQYGWHKRWPPNYFQWAQFSSDGSQRGTGSIYGIAYQVEADVVYYNRSKLQALGASVPKTFAEFEAILAKAKAAGETPILLANLEKWPGGHFFNAIDYPLATSNELKAVNDFAYGRKPSASLSSLFANGAAILRKWTAQGYFNVDMNNLSVNDLAAKFTAGTGIFVITTSLVAPSLAQAMGANAGIFVVPPQQPGGPSAVPGAESTPFGIPSGSKHQAEAAMYLDFLTGPPGAAIAAKGGGTPAIKTDYKPPSGSLQSQMFPALQSVMAANGLTPWIDGATPTMVDTQGDAIQLVMAGKITPAEFADKIISDFKTAHP